MMQGRKSEIYVHFTHYVFSNAKLSPWINHRVRIDRCWFFGVENYRVPRHFLARFAALFSSVYINLKIILILQKLTYCLYNWFTAEGMRGWNLARMWNWHRIISWCAEYHIRRIHLLFNRRGRWRGASCQINL